MASPRLAVVAVAALVLALAAALAVRDDVTLPDWIPEELAGLTARPGDARLMSATREDAIAAVHERAFPGGEPGSEPTVLPVRVTGRYLPLGGSPVSPTGHVFLATAEDKPAWLVAWRRLDEGARTVPATRTGRFMNAFFVVDESGGCCLVSLFTPPD